MKFITAAALASMALAAPLKSRQMITDVQILQFALTLEHLENVFYKGFLSQYPLEAVTAAGFTEDYYNNLKYIARDEEAHVLLISGALESLGETPVAACEYSFPYTDVMSFVGLSSVLEGVGTSAYLGAAPAVQSPDYLGVAGAILVSEALHTSLTRFNLGQVAAATYGTPLGANEVFTLAAAFITSCPSSNVALPFTAFPTLTAFQGTPTAPGITFQFQAPDAAPQGTFFATFISGLSTVSVPATLMDNGWIETTVPEAAEGQTYVVLTNANVTGPLTDDLVIAGPAIIEVTLPSPTFDISIQ